MIASRSPTQFVLMIASFIDASRLAVYRRIASRGTLAFLRSSESSSLS